MAARHLRTGDRTGFVASTLVSGVCQQSRTGPRHMQSEHAYTVATPSPPPHIKSNVDSAATGVSPASIAALCAAQHSRPGYVQSRPPPRRRLRRSARTTPPQPQHLWSSDAHRTRTRARIQCRRVNCQRRTHARPNTHLRRHAPRGLLLHPPASQSTAELPHQAGAWPQLAAVCP